MPDDIKQAVQELLEEGYTYDEIRRALVEDGYSAAVVDGVLDELERDSSTAASSDAGILWNMQQYSWLLLYGCLLVAYGLIATRPTVLLNQSSVWSPALSTGAYVVGGILLLHLVIGLYQIYAGQRRLGALSVGVVVLGAGAVFTLLLVGQGMLAGNVTPMNILSGGGSLPLMSLEFLAAFWAPNIVLLLAAVVLMLFFWPRFHGYAVVPVLLFVLLFGGLWGMHFVGVQDAVANVETGDFQHPLLQERNGDEFSTLLQSTAMVPPPFSRTSIILLAISQVGADYTWWSSIWERRAGSAEGMPLTGPGAVCSGTTENAEERFSHDPIKIVAFTQEKLLLEDTREHRDDAVATLQEHCQRTAECDMTADAIRSEYDRIAQIREANWNLTKQLIDVREKNFSGIEVDKNCEDLPETYYRVRLENVTCGTEQVATTVRDTGTRTLGDSAELIVYDNTSSIVASSSSVQVTPSQSGALTLTADEFDLPDTSLKEGRPYRVEWVFYPSDAQVSAYCVGGNGFCEDCRLEERPSGQGYNQTVLVR